MDAEKMRDVVVTVPLSFGWDRWIEEGDPAGEPWSGGLWEYTTWGARPKILPGDRVYVVHARRLRGYAPLVRLEYHRGEVVLIRGGGAGAVTDVFLVLQVGAFTEDGDGGDLITSCHYGESLREEPLAAYGFGRARKTREEVLAQLLKGGRDG